MYLMVIGFDLVRSNRGAQRINTYTNQTNLKVFIENIEKRQMSALNMRILFCLI